MASTPHSSRNMDWPLRTSTSNTRISAVDSTASNSSITASPDLSTRGIGVQMISEADILRQPSLADLCLRAIDARAGTNSVLGDKLAASITDSLNIDTSRIGGTAISELFCLRALMVDVYCQKFADAHSEGSGCTILNLTTGLDTRFMRLKPMPHVRWVEVDTPELTHLRQRLFPPASSQEYLHVGAGARATSSPVPPSPRSFRHGPPRTSHDSGFASGYNTTNNNILELAVENMADTDSWLHKVPADHPTLVILENGWTKPKPEFLHIMNSVVNHFPHGGRILFDVVSRINVLLFRCKVVPPVKMFTFKIQWHCDDEEDFGKEIHEGLRFCERKQYHHATIDDNEEWLPNFYGGKLRSKLLSKMPGFNDNARVLIYDFGEATDKP